MTRTQADRLLKLMEKVDDLVNKMDDIIDKSGPHPNTRSFEDQRAVLASFTEKVNDLRALNMANIDHVVMNAERVYPY